MSLFFLLPTGFFASPQLTDVTDPNASIVVGTGGDRPISQIRFNADGNIQEEQNDTGTAPTWATVGTWLDETAGLVASDWEINFTVDSEDTGANGTWTGATRGSYIDLSADRTFVWTKDASTSGTANSEVTITIRQVTDNNNSATLSNVSFDAQISL